MATMIGLDYIKNPVYTEEIGGIVRGMSEPFYFHKISLYVEADWRIDVIAGFSKKLNASGILGRTGFFDSFKITFDQLAILLRSRSSEFQRSTEFGHNPTFWTGVDIMQTSVA
jgi:hypothetical protein